jgi:hypothetical protein
MLFYQIPCTMVGIFFVLEILGDAGGYDQIRQSQSAVVLKLGLGLKVQHIARGWLAKRQLRRLSLRQATSLIRGSPEAIKTMGLPQWQGWAAVHSANGFKDYSGALSTVYISSCDNNNVGGPNILDLATHMAKYQPVLIELQVRAALEQATLLIQGSPEAIMTMGLPQWQGWAAVHSVNGIKDYSRALSTVYVSCCHKNTDGVPNILDLATHMAKYQPILTEPLVKKVLKKVLKILSGNAGGSGENCESQSELNYIRGGGCETQDGN